MKLSDTSLHHRYDKFCSSCQELFFSNPLSFGGALKDECMRCTICELRDTDDIKELSFLRTLIRSELDSIGLHEATMKRAYELIEQSYFSCLDGKSAA